MSRRGCAARAVGAAVAAAATGCLSTPPYQPEVAVAYTDDGAGGTASGPGFALHFATGTGFHFPDRLAIDGSDILGHDPDSACFAENEAGIQLKPTPRISADGDAVQVENQLATALRGPAVVQVQLAWATRLSCSTMRAPHGTSTFTVFPDGRIVRRDTLDDASSMPLTAITCACDSQGNTFTVSSYWTLDRTPFHEVDLPQEDPRPVPMGDSDLANVQLACLAGTSYHVGSAWRDHDQSTIHGSDAVVALGRYRIFGDSNFDAFPWDTSAALFIDRSGCDAVLRRAREYADPSPLTVNGTAVIASERDGIYGGDTGDGPGIALAAARAEITGPVDDAFAVWLQFPRSVEAVRASLDGATGAWYLPQQIDDRSWILWFRDPLHAGQTIVVEPR